MLISTNWYHPWVLLIVGMIKVLLTEDQPQMRLQGRHGRYKVLSDSSFVQKLYFDRLEICVYVMCRVVQMRNECI